eukprot:CAMPEP_0177424190 /NCGR_PEP_ID=MMETSP0368-20130122/72306_1 /TAXON_ID=447022 ORGANISM="Scrippsiella hangoei-like, Strain SHHI-4" /NCGR_SAMPLE_ID=MMETSP0368 /ASSEMBLY_ACC=CAM_ASM_000363 /LENGTH=93 /DNA_ID=CAMNT_0018894331 /DNA_START=75 /DNA_END=356 /DNA_ORIENTATION=+
MPALLFVQPRRGLPQARQLPAQHLARIRAAPAQASTMLHEEAHAQGAMNGHGLDIEREMRHLQKVWVRRIYRHEQICTTFFEHPADLGQHVDD